MSFTNPLFPNSIDLRARKTIFDEVWTKALDSEEYVRLLPGDGGPSEIPYYLKANSIKIDGEGTSTLLDSNSVDVNDLTEEKGASLLADRLIFGESGNNSSLTKSDVDFYSKLKNIETGALITNTTSAAGTVPVVYNPTAKTFSRSRIVYLEDAGFATAYMAPTSFQTQLSATNSVSMSVYNGYISDNGTHRFRVANGSGGLGYRNKAILKGVHVDETAVTIGDMTSDGFYSSGKHLRLFENSLLIKDLAGSYTFNKADILTTNNLKALAGKVIDPNSKMVIYDPATARFDYSDIPSGGVVPAWAEATRAYFKETIDPGVGGVITNEMVLNKELNVSTRQSMARTDASVTTDGFEHKRTTTTAGTGVYTRLALSHAGLTVGEKATTGGTETTTLITTNDLKGLGKSILEWAPTNAITWYRHGGANSTTHGQGQLETGAYQLGSVGGPREYPLRIVLTSSVLGNYYCPTSNIVPGQWLKINFATNNADFRLSGGGTLSKSYLPIRFANLADQGIFQLYCDDSRLKVTIINAIYEHKGSVYSGASKAIIVENTTGLSLTGVCPTIYLRFHHSNTTKTGDAVITSPAP